MEESSQKDKPNKESVLDDRTNLEDDDTKGKTGEDKTDDNNEGKDKEGNRKTNDGINATRKVDDPIKTGSVAVRSKDETSSESASKLGPIEDKETIPGGGASKEDKPLGRRPLNPKEDISTERGAPKEPCAKPKCILSPLPVVASEFQPHPPAAPHPSDSANAAHRSLPRQRHAPLAMGPPAPPMTTHIPRLHRHCVMSYDGAGGGNVSGGSVSGSQGPPSSASRLSGSSARMSPTQSGGARRESVEDEDGVGNAGQQQYVVNVHVNPGETFSVCVSDQVQLIQGRRPI